MTFGMLIKFERMKLRMTQKTLASRLNVTEDFISKMESGKSKVPAKKLRALVKALNLNKEDLAKFLINEATKQIVDSLL